MKVFKFRVENLTYVRWNFNAMQFKDYLYTSFNTSIQDVFDMTLNFKKFFDRLMNNQRASIEKENIVREKLEKLRFEINEILKESEFCPVFSESPFHFEVQIFSRSLIYQNQQYFLKLLNPSHSDTKTSQYLLNEQPGSVNDLLYETYNKQGKYIAFWERMSIDHFTQTIFNINAIICFQILAKNGNSYIPIDLSLNFAGYRKFLRQIFQDRIFRKQAFPSSTLVSDDFTLHLFSKCAEMTHILRSLKLIDQSQKVIDGHFVFPNMTVNPFNTRILKSEILFVLKLDKIEENSDFEMFIRPS